jgi:hypothetical protein
MPLTDAELDEIQWRTLGLKLPRAGVAAHFASSERCRERFSQRDGLRESAVLAVRQCARSGLQHALSSSAKTADTSSPRHLAGVFHVPTAASKGDDFSDLPAPHQESHQLS